MSRRWRLLFIRLGRSLEINVGVFGIGQRHSRTDLIQIDREVCLSRGQCLQTSEDIISVKTASVLLDDSFDEPIFTLEFCSSRRMRVAAFKWIRQCQVDTIDDFLETGLSTTIGKRFDKRRMELFAAVVCSLRDSLRTPCLLREHFRQKCSAEVLPQRSETTCSHFHFQEMRDGVNLSWRQKKPSERGPRRGA